MNNKALELISDFNEAGWNTPHLYERVAELAGDSKDAYAFCEHFLSAQNKRATIFDDLLSYVDKEQFAALIVMALDILKQKQHNENAENVIDRASLQFPELLHDHINLIFDLRPNESSFSSDYPWRALPRERIALFKDKLHDPSISNPDKKKLFNCILETRTNET